MTDGAELEGSWEGGGDAEETWRKRRVLEGGEGRGGELDIRSGEREWVEEVRVAHLVQYESKIALAVRDVCRALSDGVRVVWALPTRCRCVVVDVWVVGPFRARKPEGAGAVTTLWTVLLHDGYHLDGDRRGWGGVGWAGVVVEWVGAG